MLHIQGLRKSYGPVRALRGVDLHVDAGSVVALLGPNGAGKSTTVSIVAGLRRPDAGSVTVGGVDAVRHPRAARALIGVAPQDLAVYPVVTVRDNLRLFGELAGLRGGTLRRRIDQVAHALLIDDLLHRLAGDLSGGQKRRLHTAIALLHQPRLLLLDEATSGADVPTRKVLLALVRELAAGGTTVLYSTHYLPEVQDLDARIVVLNDGRVIADGSPADLLRHGDTTVELRFDGDAPPLHLPHPPDTLVRTTGDTVRIHTGDPTTTMAAAMAALGGHTGRLRSARVVQPDLESVYLTMTTRATVPAAHGAQR